jgi:hypothetical protein
MNIKCHVIPKQTDIQKNEIVEPEGERLRKELTEWLNKNGIVSILLDTPEHLVDIQIVKLPPRIKNVLTLWGSIYVRNDRK